MRLAALVALLPLAMLIGVAVGGAALAPNALVHALLHPSAGGDAATIVWQLRVPRVAIAATVGVALALAGTLLQALLRNPIVDPYLTGVASGAGASIAIAATVGIAPVLIPPMGFVSGLATAVLVAVLARRGPRLDPERLVLAGISLSALLSAIVALALERLARGTASEAILAWLAGSLAGRGWGDLAAAAPEMVLGVLIGAATIPSLNVLRLGEGRAATLGVDVIRLQWALLVATTLLTAAAVALAGLLGFVGTHRSASRAPRRRPRSARAGSGGNADRCRAGRARGRIGPHASPRPPRFRSASCSRSSAFRRSCVLVSARHGAGVCLTQAGPSSALVVRRLACVGVNRSDQRLCCLRLVF